MQPNEPKRSGVMPNTPSARRRAPLSGRSSQPAVSGYVGSQPGATVSYNSGGQRSGGRRMRRVLLLAVVLIVVLGLVALYLQFFAKPGSPKSLSTATGVSFASVNTPNNFTASTNNSMHTFNTKDGTCFVSYGILPSKTFKATKIDDIMTEVINPIRISGSDVSDAITVDDISLANARGDVTYSLPTRQFTAADGQIITTTRYSVAQIADKKFVIISEGCTAYDGTDPSDVLDQKLKSVVQSLQIQTDPASSK